MSSVYRPDDSPRSDAQSAVKAAAEKTTAAGPSQGSISRPW